MNELITWTVSVSVKDRHINPHGNTRKLQKVHGPVLNCFSCRISFNPVFGVILFFVCFILNIKESEIPED